MIATYLARSVRSEATKVGGRNPLWYAVIPAAVLLPLALNFGIAEAAAANVIQGAGGMDTDNAAYWVLVFSTFILMSAGVSALGAEFKDRTAETVFGIQPRRRLLPIAELAVFGLISAAVTFATTFVLLGVFPRLFPTIWGRVDAFSPEGIRLLICVPIVTVAVCALGLGVAAFVPKPALVVTIVLLWKFGIEVFVTFVPGTLGTTLQRLSPFKNAELGAGQLSTIKTLFGGPDGSLLYFVVLCLAIFVLGTIRLSRREPNTD
ncbi:ABC transporter permease [Nocardia lasii]|uniref:ABC transporter permease n=1 Tax=Nocardia lasii TaxID=1616107 RepID=A0ABW1JYF0_9NOCA